MNAIDLQAIEKRASEYRFVCETCSAQAAPEFWNDVADARYDSRLCLICGLHLGYDLIPGTKTYADALHYMLWGKAPDRTLTTPRLKSGVGLA